MAKLIGKLGTWDVPHVHQWKDRKTDIAFLPNAIVGPTTRIATIGSCFASELAGAMARLGLQGEMHPAGLFYNSRSIRQEIERIFGGWPGYAEEQQWRVSTGFIHPFKSPSKVFPTEAALQGFSDDIDHRAERLFRSADLVVITLGLIETWRNPRTGNTYLQIPHPEIFPSLSPEFHRQSVAEMVDDLRAIRTVFRANTKADLVFTVSPVPLHATMTLHDVRVANIESKSRIRAAVSEFVEEQGEVSYFHSYELVTAAERLSDFMMEDGRHVHRHAVDYIIGQFLRQFSAPGLSIPETDTGWLSPQGKTAARPAPHARGLFERVGARVDRAKARALRLAESVTAPRRPPHA